MTEQEIESTHRWWYRTLEGTTARRHALARRLAELPASTVLASTGREQQALGLTRREISRLKAAEALVLRSRHESATEAPLLDPARAAVRVVTELWGQHVESFVVAVLNVHNRPLLVERVHRGSIDHCTVDAREVFRPALLVRGSSIVVGHNHPGGDPSPSRTDIELTDRLFEVGEALCVPLLDHIVVGGLDEPEWTSFAEEALLPRQRLSRANA